MTWIVKRDRDEELDPAQERERVPKRRKEDTRAEKLQWVGNALTVISKTTIVVLCRGICKLEISGAAFEQETLLAHGREIWRLLPEECPAASSAESKV